MACCLVAPSHYLNQCGLFIDEVLWHSSQGKSTENAQDIHRWYELEKCWKITSTLPMGHRHLTHWGRVTHIFVSKLTIIDSDNSLSPRPCQAIIWTIVGIVLIQILGTNFSEILIEIHTFSFKKMHLKMSSGEWSPFCLGLNVLKI